MTYQDLEGKAENTGIQGFWAWAVSFPSGVRIDAECLEILNDMGSSQGFAVAPQ